MKRSRLAATINGACLTIVASLSLSATIASQGKDYALDSATGLRLVNVVAEPAALRGGGLSAWRFARGASAGERPREARNPGARPRRARVGPAIPRIGGAPVTPERETRENSATATIDADQPWTRAGSAETGDLQGRIWPIHPRDLTGTSPSRRISARSSSAGTSETGITWL